MFTRIVMNRMFDGHPNGLDPLVVGSQAKSHWPAAASVKRKVKMLAKIAFPCRISAMELNLEDSGIRKFRA